MRRFNVTGLCTPEEDYMVNISGKIEQIKKMVDDRCYFTINQARQYGKTTVLNELKKRLESEYICIKISFEGLSGENFESSGAFCKVFIKNITRALRFTDVSKEYIGEWTSGDFTDFDLLSDHITDMCEGKKVALMIDEVDKASNNEVFLHFLSMLRKKFLARKEGSDYTFHSVILAGVYDIKNIKLKMIDEGLYIPVETENKLYNSPWNIAINFNVDMSFNPAEIASMLTAYENDCITGMNITEISGEIYKYTSGYPFLVSRICQCIDETLDKNWTSKGVQRAVNIILKESNTLFDDLVKNIETYPDLKKFLYDLLFIGEIKTFNIDNSTISLGCMFGYFKDDSDKTKISNKIFEMRIYNYFISENENSGEIKIKQPKRSEIVENGRLNMEMLLRKFAQHYTEIYKLKDTEFLERHGGLLFLTYLKPFINGHGFCHIESQVNDFKIDITVDYGSEQFVIELKLWDGQKQHEKAQSQLANYLSLKNANKGYLLTFDFRLEKNKERKIEWIEAGGKKILDVIV